MDPLRVDDGAGEPVDALLADRTIKVLALSLETVGSFAENFDGDTGAPLYARHFASWNILADRMHEELRSGNWIMDPVFDEGS